MAYIYLTWSLYLSTDSVSYVSWEIDISLSGPSFLMIGEEIGNNTALTAKIKDQFENPREGIDVMIELVRIQTDTSKLSERPICDSIER